MEWTKETLINTCVLITSKSQGNRVIEFYNSFGFNNIWRLNGARLAKGVYYGNTSNTNSHCIALLQPDEHIKIIKLPSTPRRKFPREMMVSDDGIKWQKRLVAGTINSSSKYVSYINEEFQEGQVFKFLLAWKYAKEID